MAGLGAPPFAPPIPADGQPGSSVAMGLGLALSVSTEQQRVASVSLGLGSSLTVTPEVVRGGSVVFSSTLTLTPGVGVKATSGSASIVLLADFVQGPLVGSASFFRLISSLTVSGRGPRRRGDLARRIAASTDGPDVVKLPEWARRR